MVPVNRHRQANEPFSVVLQDTSNLQSNLSCWRTIHQSIQAQTTNRLKQRNKHKNPLTAQAQSIRPVGRPGTSAESMDA
ncbi:hypothetical protein CPSG_00130 [Coccidioides posadasii str. Silveira]|uniref:Uncharacterized protein n=1 Tax=Coccidioides posadasii (strain RMSCC 757 / Silveira) TaxID=443226 RepID=E9CU42_COCPS|nr:hypothetical protein CPSG_00130 [Coccidioides posadasii str. Silveira]